MQTFPVWDWTLDLKSQFSCVKAPLLVIVTHKQWPIVSLTSSLVYSSLSRLIPDFCFCSSSHCINCPIIPLTKVTFSGRPPFLITGECWSAKWPTYTALKNVIRSKCSESKQRQTQPNRQVYWVIQPLYVNHFVKIISPSDDTSVMQTWPSWYKTKGLRWLHKLGPCSQQSKCLTPHSQTRWRCREWGFLPRLAEFCR